VRTATKRLFASLESTKDHGASWGESFTGAEHLRARQALSQLQTTPDPDDAVRGAKAALRRG
jgi:hypothetical protein